MVHVLDMQDKEDPLLKSDSEDEEIEVKKEEKKEKKPRSEKQIEAFKRTQENRKKAIELKKDVKKIEAAKLLLNEPKVKPKQKKEIVESESEEEVIIVEKRKKKSKPKRIIVEESSESEEEIIKPKEKTFKSQQNKRSITVSQPSCFFV